MKDFCLGLLISTVVFLTILGLVKIEHERTKNNELESIRKEKYELLLQNAKLQKEINRLYTREVKK